MCIYLVFENTCSKHLNILAKGCRKPALPKFILTFNHLTVKLWTFNILVLILPLIFTFFSHFSMLFGTGSSAPKMMGITVNVPQFTQFSVMVKIVIYTLSFRSTPWSDRTWKSTMWHVSSYLILFICLNFKISEDFMHFIL